MERSEKNEINIERASHGIPIKQKTPRLPCVTPAMVISK